MPMILLSKGAEILLVQFHEKKGDRVGAHRWATACPRAPSRKPRPRAPASTSTARRSPCWKAASSARKDGELHSHAGRLRLSLQADGAPDGGGLAARPLRLVTRLHQLGDQPVGVVALDSELEGRGAVRRSSPAFSAPPPPHIFFQAASSASASGRASTSGPATVTVLPPRPPFSRRTRGDCAAGDGSPRARGARELSFRGTADSDEYAILPGFGLTAPCSPHPECRRGPGRCRIFARPSKCRKEEHCLGRHP